MSEIIDRIFNPAEILPMWPPRGVHPQMRKDFYFLYHGTEMVLKAVGTSGVHLTTVVPGLTISFRFEHGLVRAHLIDMYSNHRYTPAVHLPWHSVRSLLKRADVVHVVNAARTRNKRDIPLTLILLATGKRRGMYSQLVRYPRIFHLVFPIFQNNPLVVSPTMTTETLIRAMKRRVGASLVVSKQTKHDFSRAVDKLLENALELRTRKSPRSTYS
jgi:hypothetical protein